ncbi:DUF695 domain-containing protein [Lysinibacillus sp. G4S2]|uniref:DUF695 domain-containing protein n=1 Tax=Lysinibacillus sp. G4S2 TaxID=3055859 RepID=UPI0025A2B895|nr:DUF695 domain-containing protein [Lysinibacillus sp. G4S2]MDM5246001.1 DUF695 domain-containing protein [Lysinibacillus sp. G4S2]
MSKHWDVYLDYIDEKIASIALDMDVWQEIDTEEYNHAIAVKLKIKDPNKNGFPIGSEAKKINEIEVSLKEVVGLNHIINVGRITTDGTRDIIFYSNQEKQKDLIEAAGLLIKSTGYEFEVFSIEEDENWEFYFNYLYPNQYQQQHMGNRSVVDQLEKTGDELEVARKVDHWLYFENTKMLGDFVKAIKKEGFSVEEESTEMNEQGKYSLAIYRTDSVDLNSINEVTDLLVEISEKYEGEYDGWETFVVNK